MGNGVISTLSQEQQDSLRVEYESAILKGVSDSELQARLAKVYSEMKQHSDLPPIDESNVTGQEVHTFFTKGNSSNSSDPTHEYFASQDKKETALLASSSLDVLKSGNTGNNTAPPVKRASIGGNVATTRRGSIDKEKPSFGARVPGEDEIQRSLTTLIAGPRETKGKKSFEGAVRKVGRIRRLSMDPHSFKDATEMEKAKSDIANGNEGELKVDTWESVTIQPTCAICKMAFTSEAKKEQHIKFSEVHAINLKQLNSANLPPLEEEAAVIIEDVNTSLIYAGHKLFWKTRMNVDIHLFMHVKEDTSKSVLEVVLYDSSPDKQQELPRIYLKLNVITSAIKDEDIESKLADIKKNRPVEELASMDKSTKEIVLREEARRAVISSFILPRLVQDPADNGQISYKMSTLDDPTRDPIWTGSITIDPTKVNRRKSIEDAEAFIKAHMEHFDSLNAFNTEAEKHSDAVGEQLATVDTHNATQAAKLAAGDGKP